MALLLLLKQGPLSAAHVERLQPLANIQLALARHDDAAAFDALAALAGLDPAEIDLVEVGRNADSQVPPELVEQDNVAVVEPRKVDPAAEAGMAALAAECVAVDWVAAAQVARPVVAVLRREMVAAAVLQQSERAQVPEYVLQA